MANDIQDNAPDEQPTGADLTELEVLRQKVDELQKSADTLKDQLLRKAAEFENYKRRSETDYVNLIRNANEGLMKVLIPILNDFVRSLKSASDQKENEPFYKGIELVYNKFQKVLESYGLQPFESVGKPFDVEYHDALLQVPRNDIPSNTIIEEVERGYKLNDKILRHAKVIVSTHADPQPNADTVPNNGDAKEIEKN